MNQLIGRKEMYTIISNEKQKDYIDYYPVLVIAIIEVLKKSKVTPDNIDQFKSLLEDIPVCNNVAYINNVAITRNDVDRFWKSNTRVKEFLFLQNLNKNHKIGFSHIQYMTLKLLCNYDPCIEPCKHETGRSIDINTERNTDIIVVNLSQIKQITERVNKCSIEEDMINYELYNFLNCVPVCVNFTFNYEKRGGKLVNCSLYETTRKMNEPESSGVILTFKRCIEMDDITDECEIGLSLKQYETFKKMSVSH